MAFLYGVILTFCHLPLPIDNLGYLPVYDIWGFFVKYFILVFFFWFLLSYMLPFALEVGTSFFFASLFKFIYL